MDCVSKSQLVFEAMKQKGTFLPYRIVVSIDELYWGDDEISIMMKVVAIGAISAKCRGEGGEFQLNAAKIFWMGFPIIKMGINGNKCQINFLLLVARPWNRFVILG